MVNNELDSLAVGHVYASALTDMARKQNLLADVTGSMQGLKQVLAKNPDLVRFAEAATISADEQVAVIQKVFAGRLHPLVLGTLTAMAKRDRLMFINGLIQSFDAIQDQLAGKIDVEVITANALPEDAVARLTASIAKTLGKTPAVTMKVNPSLIGGMVLRIGDTLVDGSVATQLEKIKKQLQSRTGDALTKRVEQLVAV